MLIVALGICSTLAGCGSDPREGLTSVTVHLINEAATKVTTLKGKIEDAVKKTESGKTPDFKDALAEVDALKKIAKEMQGKKMEADALKNKTTEEERKDLTEKTSEPLNRAIDRVAKANKELNETIASLEPQYKEALKTVREKLAEANGEFEAISRQR